MDKADREALTPTHNTGTFSVFADSAREWAAKCREIARDTTRETARVRLPAAALAVRLEAAAVTFKGWLEDPAKRPDVVGRGPVVAAYQDLAAETIRFLGGLQHPSSKAPR